MKRIVFVFVACLIGTMNSWCQIGRYIPSDLFSSGLVDCLCQDKYGAVWVGTDYGLNRFDGYNFFSYYHIDGDTTSLCSSSVVSMLNDSQGRLWIGTPLGLDRYDHDSDVFVHYPFPEGRKPRVSDIMELDNGTILIGTAGYGAYICDEQGVLKPTNDYADAAENSFFSYVFKDSRGRFWKSGSHGNAIVLKEGNNIRHLHAKGAPVSVVERYDEVFLVGLHGVNVFHNGQLQEDAIDHSVFGDDEVLFNCAVSDGNGNVFFGSRGHGVYVVRAGSYRMEHYDVDIYGIDLSTTTVRDMMVDRQGNLWLALLHKGLVHIPQRPQLFTTWSFETQGIRLGSPISSVCSGDNGITWCTVKGVGVYGFNASGKVVAHPAAPSPVETIYRDRQGNYWLGTDDGLFAYDPLTGRYRLKVSYECDSYNDMCSDRDGNLYISTFSRGFCVYNPRTEELRNYRMASGEARDADALCNDWIMCMMPDHNGRIWMGTSSGVSCFDPMTRSFKSLGFSRLMDNTMCLSICERSNGDIVIGTTRGLYVYDLKTKKVGRFPGSEALNDKHISYIVQSNDGDLWCSTSVGIWQYDSIKGVFVGHINDNGLFKREYLYNVGLHTDDNRIFFGNNEGLVTFLPSELKASQTLPAPVLLTGFFVGDIPVNTRTVLNGVRIAERAIPENDHFTLSYLDHTFSLHFSQLTFEGGFDMVLEYRVNGGDWMTLGWGRNEVTLSHLQPGDYHIEVRAVSGGKASEPRVITVTILAPWYRSTTAYVFYLILLLVLLALGAWLWRRRVTEQMNEDKMKFLINATHDIRSPLTLILNPLQKLKTRVGEANADVRRDIDTIESNAQRILKLVNQILDVRKIDKQQMHLHCQQTDIVSFVRGIYKMYEYMAQERGMEFVFESDAEHIMAWVDRSQFDKVVSNLLSNAFKYNSEEGGVKVRLAHTDEHVSLEVADSGSGLDADSMKHLFERFYQGKNSRDKHVTGTGIGLNLCKMIVDMHHGSIAAANRTDAQGAVFTVTIPLGNSHLKEEEMDTGEEAPVTKSVQGTSTSSGKRRVLIVDDDQEIARYISSELAHYYKFGYAPNGREGLKELLTRAQNDNEYDLVISDVMMPEMDGFTMLRMIKTNINISHIPVIMLTSKAEVSNRLEGLERGADAFLAKPFSMEELHMNIENLIQSRQRLKGKYSGAQQQTDKVEVREVKGNDEVLMERIMKAVNKNLSNSDFNVDMLTQEVGISRAQLHRKMKEMTGISTSEFIRNIRLEQAARLLKEQKINVTQVAYTVGFSNLAHFSTIFRKHFGLAPTEYAERAASTGE